ncbi:GTP cyclohydrolase FolE2 [Derxia lacustris]|uniref:GTP cyclohydrolase FolE2 n=1 Tax=Derxia lacustris TaxID=764842 RepID=UPI000A175298|nr:GTP cyclohydrolase FolE2 [Derxia lacustris]
MNQPADLSLHAAMPDVQSARDERRLAIARVGVKALRHPAVVAIAGALQPVVATWELDVALPADVKGTHMSRFVAWLDGRRDQPLAPETLPRELDDLLALLDADEGRFEAAFTFFVRKTAPVSGVTSLLDHQARWIVERRAGATRLWAEVLAPVKSLCPCSKEISAYGAHNQRSHVTVRAELLAPLELTELVRYAEESASSEIWPLLKRADEKWITERAYDNPRFVEDLVREVALRLDADARIGAYRVEVENFESIHNHSAFAVIERG